MLGLLMVNMAFIIWDSIYNSPVRRRQAKIFCGAIE